MSTTSPLDNNGQEHPAATTQPEPVELPVPPLRIRRITLHGVGPDGARFDPLDLDLSTSSGAASRVLLSLTNTGGKSTLITLLSNLVLPAASAQIGGRQVGDYVLTNDTAHVVMEWEDSKSATRFVTGVVMEWRDGGRQPAEAHRAAENMNRRWYTFRTGGDLPGIDDLPFIVEGRRTPWDKFIGELKELFVAYPGARGAVATKQHEWASTLESHTSIDPVLFRYQMRMNDDEAGAEALLSSFNSPESVVRFFVDAFSDDQELGEFAGRLTKYSELAATRPELEALAEFCGALLPKIEAVTDRADESAVNDTELRRAEIAGDELLASITARINDDAGRLAQLEADRVTTEEEVAELKRAEGRVSDIRHQLRLLAARAAAADAAAQLTSATERAESLDAERDAWGAVDDRLRVDDARERWEHTRQALEAAETGLEPLRRSTDAAAGRFAARLDTLITEAAAAADQADLNAVAADEQFESHSSDERAAAQRRTEALAELRTAERQVAAAAAAVEQAATDGWIDGGESTTDARARWDEARSTAAATVATALVAAAAADTRFDELGEQRGAVDTALVPLRSEDQRAAAELAAFDTDFTSLAEADLLIDLLGGAAADRSDLERGASLARNAAQRADARAAEQQAAHTELAAELEHLDSTGTAPAGPDTIAVHSVLIDAGIGASTGLEWIERNIVDPDQRREFIAQHPSTAGGVIVNDPARFPTAVDVLNAAELHTRTPVTVSTADAASTAPEDTHQQVVVVPHRGTWDRQWAAQRRDELVAAVATASEQESVARANGERYRQLCSQLDLFHTRWGALDRGTLVDAATAAANAVETQVRRLRELVEEMNGQRSAATALRGDAERARGDERHAENAVAALTKVAELAASAATAEASIDTLNTAVRTAATEAQTAKDSAAAARIAEREHRDAAGQYRRDAAAMRSERQSVGDTESSDDTGENLDTLRAAWASLRQELRTATAGMVEAESHRRAEDELVAAQRRLDAHTATAIARAGELAGRLEAASPDARLAAVAAARTAAERGRAELLQAEHLVTTTETAVRDAEPADPQRTNWADLDSTPEWKPADVADIDELLARLDAHSAEVRERRVGAERRHEDAKELHEAVSADVTSMGDVTHMWRRRGEIEPTVDAFTGTKDAAREAMRERIDALEVATAAATAAQGELRDALNSARAVAASSRWKDLEGPLPTRVRELSDTQLTAESQRLGEQVAALATSSTGDLENMNQHRMILRDSLIELCAAQRRLLRSVTSESKLPAGLGGVAHQSAVKIGFDVAPDDEAAARLADRIDAWALELAASPKRLSSSEVRIRWLTDAIGDTVKNRQRAGRYTVEVLKPRLDGQVSYCSPNRIPKEFSGGQVLTLAVLVFCALSKVRAQNRVGGARPPGALILDNPFGRASAEPLIQMQHGLAAHSGVQLVCATGLHDAGVDAAFTGRGSVIVKLRNDGDLRRNLSFLRLRSTTADGSESGGALIGSLAADGRRDDASHLDAITYRVER